MQFALASFGVLVISSFVPILQILILQLNGAVLYGFGLMLNNNTANLNWLNAIVAIVAIVWFYRSRKFMWIAASSVVTIIFLFPFVGYLLEGEIQSTSYPVQLMISGGAAGLTLVVVSLMKKV